MSAEPRLGLVQGGLDILRPLHPLICLLVDSSNKLSCSSSQLSCLHSRSVRCKCLVLQSVRNIWLFGDGTLFITFLFATTQRLFEAFSMLTKVIPVIHPVHLSPLFHSILHPDWEPPRCPVRSNFSVPPEISNRACSYASHDVQRKADNPTFHSRRVLMKPLALSGTGPPTQEMKFVSECVGWAIDPIPNTADGVALHPPGRYPTVGLA